jgi:hypothetical protein
VSLVVTHPVAPLADMCSQLMYSALGAGWTFVLLSGICIAGLPLPYVVVRYAPDWRRKREEQAEKRRLERKERGAVSGK